MKWTEQEMLILRDIAARKAWSEVQTRLPERTLRGARSMARQCKIFRPTRILRDWTPEEDNFFLRHRDLPDREISRLLNRTSQAVAHRRYRIGATFHYDLDLDIDKITWAYIAGFFDGEGWVGFDFKKGKNGWLLIPHLCVSNTNKEVIYFLRDKFNLQTETKVVRTQNEHRYSKNCRTQYQFALRGRKRLCAVLNGILPYLIVKKPDADFVLNYISHHDFGTCASYQEVKNLYEFRLAHHFNGDKRRALTTKKLKDVLDNWPQSQ